MVTDSPLQAVAFLKGWCQNHGIPWHEQADEHFLIYLALLEHYRHHTNLVGPSTPMAIVSDLILDSIQILRHTKLPDTIIDVGSGAGFPGIPLKILTPQASVRLVEPRTKRYAFLRLAVRELDLKDTCVHSGRFESMTPEPTGMMISKAFAPLPQWLDLCAPWARCGARIACLCALSDWSTLTERFDEDGARYAVESIASEGARLYAVLRPNPNAITH
ncbi:MAG: 16S rRNA (guanine(527)-N(7))-methyltransferase RsmG [Proteobacteria bacterium]|nr:16S rRNA (guanine(527)-N(7))-methyltransferase RsmG [Pseudomonadota bacterium]